MTLIIRRAGEMVVVPPAAGGGTGWPQSGADDWQGEID